ncbi:hypothetical protein [Collimonas pratensis]|uniref:DUF3077 domain-containing protein n=1 Tax=Collimonas pratensis TaxID=279113 RepID=A0ABM5ZC33_9BURK|nr:hypothetical protein [Collimonas pratensis]AMP16681.1 hypothetical protein CPter291_4455 [Collimonas pratensis]
MTSIPSPTHSLTEAAHQSFSWLTEDLRMHAPAQFMAITLDISLGIQTCLSLIHASDLAREQRDDAFPPPLNVADTESLTRMAMAAARMLSERAQCHIDVLNDMHARGDNGKRNV